MREISFEFGANWEAFGWFRFLLFKYDSFHQQVSPIPEWRSYDMNSGLVKTRPDFVLQPAYRDRDTILLVMGIGLGVILLSIALIVLGFQNLPQNVMLLVTGFFLLILGITAFVLPLTAFSRWDRLPVPRVRCRQCATLNYESSMRCRKCGANMF